MVVAAKIPAPSGLTATAVPVGIRLDWTNPAFVTFRVTQVYESPDSSWANATLIAEPRTNSYTSVLKAGTTRWYWVRNKRSKGLVSTRFPDSDTSTVTATAGAVTSLQQVAAGNLTGQSGTTGYRDLTVLDSGGAITSGPTTLILTPEADGKATVIGTFIGRVGSASPQGSVSVFAYLQSISTSPQVVTVGEEYVLTTADRSYTVHHNFDLTGGVQYRIGMRALSDSASNTEIYEGPVITQVSVYLN